MVEQVKKYTYYSIPFQKWVSVEADRVDVSTEGVLKFYVVTPHGTVFICSEPPHAWTHLELVSAL